MPKKRQTAEDVIHKLREADVLLAQGVAKHIRSDNGPEIIAKNLRPWLTRLGTRTMYITLGSPRGERRLRLV